MVQMSKFEKTIIDIATDLLEKGPTTTLAIKEVARSSNPDEKIYQKDVSDIMSGLAPHVITNLTYTDTGRYRIYSLNKSVTPSTSTRPVYVISRTDIVKLMKNSNGRFFTITFIKKKGDERTVNAHVKKDAFMNELGYIILRTSKNEIKLVDPKNILRIEINGESFVSKKHV